MSKESKSFLTHIGEGISMASEVAFGEGCNFVLILTIPEGEGTDVSFISGMDFDDLVQVLESTKARVLENMARREGATLQ